MSADVRTGIVWAVLLLAPFIVVTLGAQARRWADSRRPPQPLPPACGKPSDCAVYAPCPRPAGHPGNCRHPVRSLE